MKRVSIVGFGRFGETLLRLLLDDFEVTLYDIKDIDPALAGGAKVAKNVEQVYESDVIFFAVPIENFAVVIAEHSPYFAEKHLLVDVLSVKMHPANVLKSALASGKARALLTHPMFGPDSAKNGFDGLPIVVDRFNATEKEYAMWKNFFAKKGLQVVEMRAEEHDRLAASSQGLTHFIGRLLEGYPLAPSPIDTLATKKLHEVVDLIKHDSWQLFSNLQLYNPFTKEMRIRLGEVYDDLYGRLLPARVDPGKVIYGIQGGVGSFNEEAIRDYLSRKERHEHEIKYLYTTDAVMRALHAGEIDFGQFAIHNSVGGVVEESIRAMAEYKFSIVEEFAIKISHAIMISQGVDFSEITTIMAHPQVFAQCKSNLEAKYPNLKLVSGEGDLIDHAVVAKEMAAGKIPRNTATMGSRVLADIYGLKIVEDNLQEARENFTSFLLVSRYLG